jgi:hypothetical protein
MDKLRAIVPRLRWYTTTSLAEKSGIMTDTAVGVRGYDMAYASQHTSVVFDQCRHAVVCGVEKNWTFKNLDRGTFPQLETLYLLGHPCDHSVLMRFSARGSTAQVYTDHYYFHDMVNVTGYLFQMPPEMQRLIVDAMLADKNKTSKRTLGCIVVCTLPVKPHAFTPVDQQPLQPPCQLFYTGSLPEMLNSERNILVAKQKGVRYTMSKPTLVCRLALGRGTEIHRKPLLQPIRKW